MEKLETLLSTSSLYPSPASSCATLIVNSPDSVISEIVVSPFSSVNSGEYVTPLILTLNFEPSIPNLL